MSRAQRIFRSLRTQPGYTLMRGVARFSSVRHLVANTRSALGAAAKAEFLSSCESRMEQTQFPALDRPAFVKALRDDGMAFGLRLTPTRSARLLLQLQYALFDYGVMHDRCDPARLGRIA